MTAKERRAQRTCLACRRVDHQTELLRYVLSPDQHLLVDYRGKLPGRGCYTCISSDCMQAALKRGQFRRALKDDFVAVSYEDLHQALNTQVGERIENLIGMARKAGVAISGSNQVLDQLARDDSLSLVLLAEDVSQGVGAKVEGRCRREGVDVIRMFTKNTMGMMLGRGEVSVMAFRDGSLTESLVLEIKRYQQIAEGH